MFLIALAIGCVSSQSEDIFVNDCVNTSDCLDGYRCAEGTCASAECQFDHECSLQQICSSMGSCVEGCNENKDCLSGEACEQGTCVPYECRTTELDCMIGELCIEGACVYQEGLCEPCDFAAWEQGGSSEELCVIYTYDQDVRCNWQTQSGCPDQMSCFPSDGIGNTNTGFCVESFFFPTCSEQECPRGFNCVSSEGVSFCVADCIFFLKQEYIY